MEHTINANLTQDSLLSRKEKWSFFAVNIGNIPIMTLLGTYLLIFYIDIVGLNPGVIGTLFLISRVFDGFNDPIMGYVIDHLPNTKLGRFRGYLIIGTVACSINFLLLWLGPSIAPTGKVAIAYVTYILFGFTFDLMDIPLNSMIPVMSDRDKDRNSLSNIKGLGYLIGTIIFYILPIILINIFESTPKRGYHVAVIIAFFFILFFSIFGTLGIKERIQPLKGEKYKFRDLVKILGSRPVLILFLDTLISSIGAGVAGGIGIFFCIYVLKNEGLYILLIGTTVVGVLVGAAIGPKLVNKYGRKTTKIIASLISLIGPLILFFTPANIPMLFIIITLLTSPGSGINSVISYGIQADNMDFVEWEQGYRAEGAVASMSSFIIKSGSGIGSALGAYMLLVIGYIPLVEQSGDTIRGFYLLYYGIPGILSLCALLIWAFGYPLTKKKRQQMMEELLVMRETNSDL